MIRATAIGITSNSCPTCGELKNLLRKDFSKYGIEIDFVEVIYEEDPKEAEKISEEYGFDCFPSFFIGEQVFPRYYDSSKIVKAINKIKNNSSK